MGKQPVRMKAVVYALSPFQQKVMPGLWKDFTTKIHHKVSENWLSATLLVTPVIGTYTSEAFSVRFQRQKRTDDFAELILDGLPGYAQHYKEQEKLSHRY